MMPLTPFSPELILPALAVLLSFLMLLLLPGLRLKDHRLLLSFSGAFLLSVTLFELFPEVYTTADTKLTGVFIALGILVQIILEFFSKGAEHGHVHGERRQEYFPWPLFISLGLHAFLEGIPLSENQPVVWGIVVHKIPVALILGGFLLRSGLSGKAAWGFILAFALMTPLGTWVGSFEVISGIYNYLLALVIGMILHVSTIILFESSREHAVNLKKLGAIALGMILAYLL
ncbi:ZIP family metal transporter [Robiginitalea marina]|uniref:ZIP family metal transporter n=1 Tax=Robiginitalea marina TaxID=2954105 RepID=A0ABT1AUV9_9FLAO|nr:ZIP family metal transporter [Robiginitalea marina]MCO5723767.1 ZIP family metal transporter [Robiginitalea marina]